MRDARPAFQHDGAFQFAADAGFDTTPARAPLDLGLVVTFDAPSAFVSTVPRGALDLALVVTFAVTSRGPVEDFTGGGGVWEFPLRRGYRDTLEVAAVVTWDPASRFHAAPVRRRRPAMPRARRRRVGHADVAVASRLTYHAPARGFEYVRDFVIPEDDDALVLSMCRWPGVEDDDLVILDGGRV